MKNIVSLTGVVSDIRKEDNHMILLVRQKVSGTMQTGFPVVLSKDAFNTLNLKIGECIFIYNGNLYVRQNGQGYKYRVSVHSPAQIKKIAKESYSESGYVSLTFRGEVIARKEEEKSVVFAVRVKTRNENTKKSVDFTIQLALKPDYAGKIKYGDTIVVTDAKFYEYNNKFYASVGEKDQIILYSRKIDLGEVKADELFI